MLVIWEWQPWSDLSVAKHLRNKEGKLQRLRVIQSRIARRLVSSRKIFVRDLFSPANAFCYVISRELDMNSAGMGTKFVVNFEETFYFL
jgi:hypothetical protein